MRRLTELHHNLKRSLMIMLMIMGITSGIKEMTMVEAQRTFYFEVPWNMIIETPGASVQVLWERGTSSSAANVSVISGLGTWEETRDPQRIGVTFVGNSTIYELNFTIRWLDPINQTITIMKQSGGEEWDHITFQILAHTLVITFPIVQSRPRPAPASAKDIAAAQLEITSVRDQQLFARMEAINDSQERMFALFAVMGIGFTIALWGAVFFIAQLNGINVLDELKRRVRRYG